MSEEAKTAYGGEDRGLREALAAYTVPEPRPDFVADTLVSLGLDRARPPSPTADFVAQTLDRLACDPVVGIRMRQFAPAPIRPGRGSTILAALLAAAAVVLAFLPRAGLSTPEARLSALRSTLQQPTMDTNAFTRSVALVPASIDATLRPAVYLPPPPPIAVEAGVLPAEDPWDSSR